MTLLDQEVKQKEPKGKKIVLFLLIFSVILLIAIIIIMMVLSKNPKKALMLDINGANIDIQNDMLVTDENGIRYISIQKISKLIGYDYLTGEYKQYSEDTTNTKGYLQNDVQVIQFEADTNKIYKIMSNSNLDYEEYELKNNILRLNNLLYIALEDVNIGLGIVCSNGDNKISLYTVDNLVGRYKTSLQTNSQLVEISEENDNKKAIPYNILVVANQSGKWGVVDTNFSTIIGNRYTSLQFVESAGVFIASDENKYGVISQKPNQKPIIDLNYEEIKVINNTPMFYQVKLDGKYGVINSQGRLIVNIEYDSIGYTSKSITELTTIVIEQYGNNKENLLVVCKNGKYGLISLNDGRIVADCAVDKIYAKNENGERNYYIEFEKNEIPLDRYIEFINTSTVITN